MDGGGNDVADERSGGGGDGGRGGVEQAVETGQGVFGCDVVGHHHAGRPRGVIGEHPGVGDFDGGGEEAEVVADVLGAVPAARFAVAVLQVRAEAIQRGDGGLGEGGGLHPQSVAGELAKGHRHQGGYLDKMCIPEY